jgi:hypothetical protein
MKRVWLAALLLAACGSVAESEEAARQWGTKLGYNVVGAACGKSGWGEALYECALRVESSTVTFELMCERGGCRVFPPRARR